MSGTTPSPGLMADFIEKEAVVAAEVAELSGLSAAPDWGGLVQTRLRPPFRAKGTIRRERLGNAIDEVRWCAMTVVKAPAGYGKSSLLGQWFEIIRDDAAAAGWLSLDHIGDDLISFFHYAVAAIQVVRPEFGGRFALLLNSARKPSTARVCAAFINAVVEAKEQIYLFIDDFHLAPPEVADAIQTILANPPDNFHLAVATRHALPFSLSLLRLKGRLAEIDADWLRFDSGETAEFLRVAGHDSLSEQDIETLLVKTEGWPAGIQLASISLGQKHDVGSFFSFLSGAHHHLSEYLAADVINNQSPATTEFLIKTSILSRFNPDLCNFVTGQSDARLQLDILEQQSLFLCSLDTERTWYRYHHLFSRFLLKLLSDRGPRVVSALHRQASDWFAQRGLMEEAFSHAIEAGDARRAAELLDQTCSNLMYKGRLSTLLRWSDRIPPSVLREFPRARLEAAWPMILEWRFEEAARIIADVEETLREKQADQKDSGGLSINDIVTHRKMMLVHFMDDIPKMDSALLDMVRAFPEDDPYLRGNIETCQVYARREMLRLDHIDKMDARAREYYRKAGSEFVIIWHESIIGPTYFLRGDTELAEKSLAHAAALAEKMEGGISPLVAMPATLLADILCEKNELERAGELIRRFDGEADKGGGFVDHLVSYYVTKARLLARGGNVAAAQDVLRAGRISAERRGFVRLRSFIDLEEVRLAGLTNELEVARRFLAEVPRGELEKALNPGAHTTTRDEALMLAYARASSMMGEYAQAIRPLRKWAAFAGGRSALKSEVRVLILLAATLLRDGREGEALRCLREAVKKAARPQFIRSFLDEGKIVETLLTKVFEGVADIGGPTASFGRDILKAFTRETAQVDDAAAVHGDDEDGEELIVPEQLNAQESEVLRLMSVGMSNKEIGMRMGLTEGSVKWYLQRIFMKLGVRRRSMAVLRARKFGLI